MAAPAWFNEVLERELRPWVTLSSEQISALYAHYEMLVRWNQKLSLTSIEPGPELVMRHYAESLFLAAHIPPQDAVNIGDIGAGAGFPGVPVAVVHAGMRVALIESNQRKAVFLRESTRQLKNIRVIASRAEEIQDSFDWIVSRAVDPRHVLQNVPKLAPRLGLLIGEASFGALKLIAGIAWDEPIRLPWGDRRICVRGEFDRA